jgi:hypothetical protein
LRKSIETILSTTIDAGVVANLLDTYELLLARNRAGDYQAALMQAGRFVEHTFRVIEFLRTGIVPASIKSISKTMREIEGDTSTNQSLRQLIPRAAYGMIYDVRSKRNAVHVNEIDPSAIDTSLAIAAAGWILAELMRLYHSGGDQEISSMMSALTRAKLPLVEVIENEVVVTSKVPVNIEMMLLLAHSAPRGLNRSELGRQAKCSPSSVTRSLQALEADRLVHKVRDNSFFLTAPGETVLAAWLQDQSGTRH